MQPTDAASPVNPAIQLNDQKRPAHSRHSRGRRNSQQGSHQGRRARRRARLLLIGLATVTVAALLAVAGSVFIGGGHTDPSPTSPTPTNAPGHTTALVATAAQIAALPEARYNAVIPQLIAYKTAAAPAKAMSYTLIKDTAIYGEDRLTPVARLGSVSFLGEPTMVVGLATRPGWVQVLTPARQTLPSTTNGNAPAQTYGWVLTTDLTPGREITARVTVSVGAQTLSITGTGVDAATFSVGVGTKDTPTPTGVTGYLQARYLDPAQNETVHPIQLTSLHSAVADEPYGGKDGGLIGVHYQPVNTGTVSHGCIRLGVAAITAVNSLPLGTLISIEP